MGLVGLPEAVFGDNPLESYYTEILPKTLSELPLFLLLFAVLPGICEEILFRGAIQGTLERKGARRGIFLTASLFAIYHMNPWNFIGIFIVGIILGYLIIRTNSIVLPIIFHTCMNSTGLIIGAFVRNEKTVLYLGIALSFLFVISFVELMRKTRGLTPELSSLADASSTLSVSLKKVVIGVIVIPFVLLILARIFIVSTFTMRSDTLKPDVNNGDKIVVLNRGFYSNIKTGDIIVFRQNGQTFLRRVKGIDGDEVIIEPPTRKVIRRIPREDIRGKIIYKFNLGK
ncbi:hypothetical protein ES707_19337 [subsurface metagenome]